MHWEAFIIPISDPVNLTLELWASATAAAFITFADSKIKK